MPSVCFVDTNVFLYAKDPTTPGKMGKAVEWIEVLSTSHSVVVSPQVLNEFAHNVIRKLKHIGPDLLRAYLESMRPWCTAPLVAATSLEGLAIHQRFKFSLFDSVLVASAMASRCDLFLSEDLGNQQRIGPMRIVNPFSTDPLPYLEEH